MTDPVTLTLAGTLNLFSSPDSKDCTTQHSLACVLILGTVPALYTTALLSGLMAHLFVLMHSTPNIHLEVLDENGDKFHFLFYQLVQNLV